MAVPPDDAMTSVGNMRHRSSAACFAVLTSQLDLLLHYYGESAFELSNTTYITVPAEWDPAVRPAVGHARMSERAGLEFDFSNVVIKWGKGPGPLV